MTELQTIIDRSEIEALRAEYTDAGMMRDIDRLASLFTEDAAWRIPVAGIDLVGRDEIRTGIERGQGLWEIFVQTSHSGVIRLDGEAAVGRVFVAELGRFHDGRSHQNRAIFHDRYRRTEDGWKFTERVYEIRYVDTSPLAGSGPEEAAEDLRVDL